MKINLKTTFLFAASISLIIIFQNCGKPFSPSSALQNQSELSSSSDPNPSNAPILPDWNIGQLNFNFNSNNTFDLKTTLASGLKPNGVFSVDPAGAPLPSGMTLSSSGILSVGSAGSSLSDLDISGVKFNYDEPN